MTYDLPENCQYIDYPNFSSDGYYDLAPGETLIFPWEIEKNSETEINLIHTDMNTQDHSVKAWLSKKPLDDVMFYRISFMNYMDIQRNGTSVTIYDQNTQKDKNLLRESSSRGYFLNVKNMSNEPNAFRLTFSYSPDNDDSSTGDNSVTTGVNHTEKVGTMTDYGEVVAQLEHGLTLVKSKSGNGHLISLMRNNDIIGAVKIDPDASTKDVDDIKGTYLNGADNDAPYLHLLMEWVVDNYNPLNISGLDASMNRNFWDVLLDYPGTLNFTFVDRNGNPIKLTKETLECETLWERI